MIKASSTRARLLNDPNPTVQNEAGLGNYFSVLHPHMVCRTNAACVRHQGN